MARTGKATLLISDVLADELLRAPSDVASVLGSLAAECLKPLDSTDESEYLRNQYLAAGVVGPGSASDAHHIAIATVAQADLVVSWNFKHIVHFDKIR